MAIVTSSGNRFWRFLYYAILFAVGGGMVLPLLWMLVTSLRERAGTSFFPSVLDWRNYVEMWTETNMLRYVLNSLFISLTVTAAQVMTSAMAAFAFSRLRFPGRDKLFLLYISTMMIPGMVTLIPRFILLRELGMIDTYAALILPAAFSAYGTFMLRQFFLGIDRELEEAAIIDGCGAWGVFFNVIMPLSRPALATLAIFTFMGAWRNFLTPLIFTDSERVRVVSLGIYAIRSNADNLDWGLLMACSVVMLAPMVLIFALGQKHFMSGLRLGGIKG